MGWQEDRHILEDKEDLVDRVTELMGAEPLGIRPMLRALAHPQIVQHAVRYFQSLDESTKCLKYEPPWNCAREAEAKYENIKYGWFGGANGIGFDESWCENCRRKVVGDVPPEPQEV